jgi:hypothetical protein
VKSRPSATKPAMSCEGEAAMAQVVYLPKMCELVPRRQKLQS